MCRSCCAAGAPCFESPSCRNGWVARLTARPRPHGRPTSAEEVKQRVPQVVKCNDAAREARARPAGAGHTPLPGLTSLAAQVSVAQSVAGKTIERTYTFDKARERRSPGARQAAGLAVRR